MGELLFAAVVEALRFFGAWLRRVVFGECWDEGNDAVDTALGLAVILVLSFSVGAGAYLWFG
jgi:hypothetical protein